MDFLQQYSYRSVLWRTSMILTIVFGQMLPLSSPPPPSSPSSSFYSFASFLCFLSFFFVLLLWRIKQTREKKTPCRCRPVESVERRNRMNRLCLCRSALVSSACRDEERDDDDDDEKNNCRLAVSEQIIQRSHSSPTRLVQHRSSTQIDSYWHERLWRHTSVRRCCAELISAVQQRETTLTLTLTLTCYNCFRLARSFYSPLRESKDTRLILRKKNIDQRATRIIWVPMIRWSVPSRVISR